MYKPAAIVIKLFQFSFLVVFVSIPIAHFAVTFCFHVLTHCFQADKRLASIIAIQTHKIFLDLNKDNGFKRNIRPNSAAEAGGGRRIRGS